MKDRELLELAAKAAGYESKWDQPRGSNIGWLRVLQGDRYPVWNPLTDDAEAHRLAVKLELDVMHRVVGGKRVEVLAAGGPLVQEFYEGNAYIAARRAIVRAAAEVGRKRATKEPK